MDTNKKNNNLITCAIIVFLMIACFVGGIFTSKLLNSEKKDNNSENNEKGKETEVNYLLDQETLNELESMRTDLKGLLKNGYKAYNIKCKYVRENDIETENEYVELSNNSVDQIVNKLKSATSVEKDRPTGFLGCSPRNITYIINNTKTNDGNKKLIVMYGDETTLLVGYNQIGNIYHFSNASDINNFLENLSK